jgi:hypothetical protein
MRIRRASLTSSLVRTLMFGTMMSWLPPAAVACGYHDNVALARGVLNWVYPDALHVVGAISTAVAERRLPAATPVPGALGLLGFHGAVRSLEQHTKQLRMVSGETPSPAFSLLLIEPMLWTRFVAEEGDLRAQVHASGPQAGDLVLISGEEVIREVTRNRLTIGEAHRRGLVRLYGTAEQVALFLTRYDRVGGVPADQ